MPFRPILDCRFAIRLSRDAIAPTAAVMEKPLLPSSASGACLSTGDHRPDEHAGTGIANVDAELGDVTCVFVTSPVYFATVPFDLCACGAGWRRGVRPAEAFQSLGRETHVGHEPFRNVIAS